MREREAKREKFENEKKKKQTGVDEYQDSARGSDGQKKELHVSCMANEPTVKQGQFLISPEEWQLQMS